MRINFVGDVNFSGKFSENILEKKEILSLSVKKKFLESDFNVVNFEGPETREAIKVGGPIIISEEGSIKYLVDNNISVFNLGNNHIFDCGDKGYIDTISEIKKNKAVFFGAGMNLEEASEILYLKKNKVTVALINIGGMGCKFATNSISGVLSEGKLNLIEDKIKEARFKSDWIIINYHGGAEYTLFPLPKKRRFLKKIANLDIDLIIAHHSHTLQGMEIYNGKSIFYSLGNFIFDFEGHKNIEFTDRSAIISIDFTKERIKSKVFTIKLDLNNGIVNEDTEGKEHFDQISDFSDFKKKWFKDCYRTFFQPNSKPVVKETIDTHIELRSKSVFRMLLNKSFYRGLYVFLKNDNIRPIFINAILGKIKFHFYK